ncbi:MAG: TIGR03118 family protein [Acidobacteria bacterium]|nr:TIGR03118 family protein [Acidobacteriota bacterium]
MIRENAFRFWTLVAPTILCMAVIPQLGRAAGYIQRNLVSDVPLLADFTDPNMVNPWGLALAPFWICNNRTGTYNVYGVDGNPTTLVTTVPPAPGKPVPGKCAGAVRNTNNAAFQVSPGVNGTWLLATEDGLLTIRSGATNVIKVDNSVAGAVYKGLALSNNPDYAYAANFNSGKIDVYDGTWAAATLPGTFTDPQVPAGFAPFNIQNLGGKLYVAYAKQDAAQHDDVGGPGNGYVAVFDLNGNLLQHLISGGPLNSPWGLTIAPANFGEFSGALLVGNFRDGFINAFNVTTGAFLGTIQNPSGQPIVNIGLWAVQTGIGGNGGDPTKVYFTAGISAGSGIQSHGLLGTIPVASNVGDPPSINVSGVVNNGSYAPGTNAIAPGSIAAIFGTNPTDGTSCAPPTCTPTLDNGNPRRVRTFMAGAQVTINGFPVPIFYALPTQLGIQIPTDLTGTSATVQVTAAGQPSTTRSVSIDAFSPGVFSFSGDGRGAGAITHGDGTPVDASSPARQGEAVVIYLTGLGQTTPAALTGALAAGTTVTLPTVTMDSLSAVVQFSGLASCCAGLNQINAVVPSNVRIGTDISVVVTIGGKASNTVTIATRVQ